MQFTGGYNGQVFHLILKPPCNRQALRAAGVALRGARRTVEPWECHAPGELWEDRHAFDLGFEDRPWGDMEFVARFQ